MKNIDHLIFPETISVYQLNIKEEILENFINKLNFIKVTSFHNDEPNTFTSKESNVLDNFIELKNKIIFCCDDYLKNKFKLNINFEIIDSWATMTKKNGYSRKHSHAHSFLSGVFYPFLKEKAKIKFYRRYVSDFWDLSPDEYNINNSDCFTVEVKTNDLIIFKSYLQHEIVKYNGKNNRYSIAFNVTPIGNLLGSKNSKLFIKCKN
jgi:uncharacterized protein (TIGR02466 family)